MALITKKATSFCFGQNNNMDEHQSISILDKNHYVFRPLIDDIEPLNEPKCDFSFIVPVYNSERFLSQCLDSLFNQKTSFKYEVICINDGSTDGSLSILNSYAQRFANLIVYSQNNSGISAARNKGIALASGEYLGFVDNDDTVSEDYVDRLLKTAKETGADMVQCGYTNQTIDGEIQSEVKKKKCVINAVEQKDLFNNVLGYIWSGAYKRHLFDKVRFPLGYWYEDMITRMLLMRITNTFAVVSQTLYNKTIHQANASKILWKNGNIKAVDQFYLAKRLAEYGKEGLGLQPDDLLINTLLTEWSRFLWTRTRGLNHQVQQAVFSLASDYIVSIGEPSVFYSEELKKIFLSFCKKDYYRWKLISLSMMLKAKAQQL